ncbi:hypothetical protein ZWY2020_018806 [Hordeum vulgare]|nr:hypothetical protein ZWY2020_018806 [Hordeum vulgare]
MFSSLAKVFLGGNRLFGQIPSEICSCAWLQLLDLGDNLSSNVTPARIGTIPGQIDLDLSCNGLLGAMPKEFTEVKWLGMLDVSHIQLIQRPPADVCATSLLTIPPACAVDGVLLEAAHEQR